jgi:hypothetical protein
MKPVNEPAVKRKQATSTHARSPAGCCVFNCKVCWPETGLNRRCRPPGRTPPSIGFVVTNETRAEMSAAADMLFVLQGWFRFKPRFRAQASGHR